MITASHLSKHYVINHNKASMAGFLKSFIRPNKETVAAVSNLEFEIKTGAICGIVGLNGAGKSTLIKMLTGVMKASAGDCRVMGYHPFNDRQSYVQNIGVVFGQRSQMIWDLPVRNSLDILRPIYRVEAEQFTKNLAYYTSIFGVDEFIDQPVRLLSLGQRMRAEIVSALLHDPKVLFLDEPTIGLDVLVKKKIRQAIADMNKTKGTTVILTSHDLDDIDTLCDQLIVLDKGQVLFDGEKSAFIEQYRAHKTITIKLADNAPVEHELLSLHQAKPIAEQHWSLAINEAETSATEVIKELVNALPVIDLTIQEQKLEDVLQTIY